jgi:ADP-ribosylglycohydrolase
MKNLWLYLNHSDIETERRQCEEEGRDLATVEEEFTRVLALDLEELENQPAAQALLDKTIALPLRAEYSYHEPNGLEAIRAARPKTRPALPAFASGEAEWLDKLHGAWTGRCCGCLLGKPVEGWKRERLWGYLRDSNRWPLSGYLIYDVASEVQEKYQLDESVAWGDKVSAMPEDDDTNYTTTGLAILKRNGPNFSPQDVAGFWLQNIPVLHTCTAERVAYRNLCKLIAPPQSASFRNPYREWIGAQIRADLWGYVCPGEPQRAAEFAWRDASISHVKNGIYGEMWAAAMIAAAFVCDDIKTIIRAGLGEVPENCRLAGAVERVLGWHQSGLDYDAAVEKLHQEWNESNVHDWCHTISNAMIVAIGLLWGEGDFEKTICRAVQACFDTDCNGATCGSILGILHGRRALPEKWTGVLHDTLHTGVAGYHVARLADLAQESRDIARSLCLKPA